MDINGSEGIVVELVADLILLNGKVVTVDPKDTIVEAVAVKERRIVRVGTSEEVKSLVGEETKIIDLRGKTLLPGFVDTHCHPALGGTETFEVDCRSPPVKSIKEILEKIREKAEKTPKDEWIRARNYNENKLLERRHITRWELDQATPDNPVFISKETGHLYVVNSKALELAGITKDTPDPSGGKIDRDPKTGEATGLLYETAAMKVMKLIPPYDVEQIKKGLKHVFKRFLAWGLTTIHQATAIPVSIKACQELLAAGEMPIRINMMIGTLPGILPGYEVDVDLLDLLVKLGFQSGFGGDKLKIMSVKLIADGSGSGGSAAVYTPQHRGTKGLGILVTSPEKLTEQVIKAHKAGFRVSIHAIGDRGIDAALNAIEAALREPPTVGMRHRIEHCSVCTPKQQERVKKLGVVPCSSIGYMWGVGDDYIENFGPERLRWLHPHRSYMHKGIIASGNSDWPVSTADPMKQIYSAVTRKTKTGQSFDERERITVMEAIRTYTWNGAYASCEEDTKGSIEPGKLADMVILSEDILTVPEEKIKDIKIDMTIVGGEVVYQRSVA